MKSSSTTPIDAKGLMMTLKASSDDFPLLYVESLWDIATTAQKANLVALLGAQGQYSQDEINKAIADKLAEIATNLGKVASAGAYVSSNGNPFASKEALNAATGANADDYALVTVTETVDNVATVKQLVRYTRDEDAPKQIKVDGVWYMRNANGDQDPEGEGVVYPYCWSNGTSNVYTKVESVKTRSGSEAQEDEQAYSNYTSEGTADDIEAVFANWREDYALDKSQFTTEQWELISAGQIDEAMALKLNDLPTAAMLTEITSDHEDRIGDIEDLIPSQATSENQLADKAFVNSSISTNTATFRGTYESVNDLPASQEGLKENDYAFVIGTPTYAEVASPEGNPAEQNYMEKSGNDYIPSTDTSVHNEKTYYVSQGNPSFLRYKYASGVTQSITIDSKVYAREKSADKMTGGGTSAPMYAWKNGSDYIYTTSNILAVANNVNVYVGSDTTTTAKNITAVTSGNDWIYEYTLNNSSFTATQWATINSGLTASQQKFITDEIKTKASEKFTVEISKTGDTSVDADDTGSKTLVVKAVVKFNGTAVNLTDSSGAEYTPTGWTKTSGKTGEYTISKTYDRDSNSTARTISLSSLVFSHKVTEEGPYKGQFLSKTITQDYTATISYPYWIGWDTDLGKATITSADLTTAAVNDVIGNLSRNGAKTYTSVTGASTSTPKRLWIVCKNSASAVQQVGSVDLVSATGVSFSVSNVSMSGYKVYVTKNRTQTTSIDKMTISVS